MAYTLVTQSFGAFNANAYVAITNSTTGVPATILSSATGGLVNSNGLAQLDSSGNLSVYIDTAITWTYTVSNDHQNLAQVQAIQRVNSVSELLLLTGQLGVLYLVYLGPSTPSLYFYWDGLKFVTSTPFVQTVASSATPALDLSQGKIVIFNTGANATVTWAAPTNVPTAGSSVTVIITQDATGGRTVAWNAAYIFPTAWTNTGNTANKVSTQHFVSDGTKLVATGANSWY